MLGIILTTLIFIGVLVGLSKLLDLQKIKNNWEKYRCRPDVMIMADIYGHNATQNLEFCLKNGFDERAQSAIAPFYKYLANFTQVLSTLLGTINSIAMTFATLTHSVTQIFSEFSSRIQALFYQFQMSAIRLKFLMGRVFATMYSVIFMGMSGIKAAQNFGNTFLFRFLDTFCFDPDTEIIVNSGKQPIRLVKIGDVLENGEVVTATFQFIADGQPMVQLPGNIVVSTNHYIYLNGWILAKDHPEAIPISPWAGGINRPLICLNTTTHTFKIGKYTFRDYDETEEGDKSAMEQVMCMLNGNRENTNANAIPSSSVMTCSPDTIIKGANGLIPASDVTLGTMLSTGKVVGIVKKLTDSICIWENTSFGPGTAVWSKEEWIRVSSVSPIQKIEPTPFYSFIVTPSACIETESGVMFRDYMEVHDPSIEAAYASALMQEDK